jgi:hypothetical protein
MKGAQNQNILQLMNPSSIIYVCCIVLIEQVYLPQA